MWIKICGNTNLDDAQMAADLGADAVGFVFAPSVRQTTPADVARITPHLPPTLERIGVFSANKLEDAEAIAQAVREAGLTAVQLHGGVSLTLLQRLEELLNGEIKIVPVVHWHVDADAASSASVSRQLTEISQQGIAQRVLIDSKFGRAIGGTGISFDWDAARSVLADSAAQLNVIVAGGLRPDNVAEAIRRLNPWGVDVSSGVEAKPGRKDPEKLTAFISNARSKNNAG
jgi:phosphoribosylanthranilate isomerase